MTQATAATPTTNTITHEGATIGIETFSPERAAAALRTREETTQRVIGEKAVCAYVRAMEEGAWTFDGSPLRFDADDVLLDGNHRLSAVVKSGTTQTFLVVRGIDRDARLVTDTGKIRSAADQLQLLGYKHHRELAAMAAMFWHYLHLGPDRLINTEKVTAQETVNIVREYPQMEQCIRYVKGEAHENRGPHNRGVPHAMLAYVYFLAWHDEGDTAPGFVTDVFSASTDDENPAGMLRRLMVKDSEAQQKYPYRTKLALVIKAWNSWRSGGGIKRLKWKSWGVNSERFPVVQTSEPWPWHEPVEVDEED